MIRVLHIVTHMNCGGLETMIMNYYRNIDRSKVQFDFLVHRDYKGFYDDEILSLGGRIFKISKLIPWSYHYRKELKAFFKNYPEYQIIHVHQDCLSSVALKCAREMKIPIRIAHSHNSSQDKNMKYPIKIFYKRSIPKYATDLFACSKEAGDWMFNGEKSTVLPNAINLEDYVYNQTIREKIRTEFKIDNEFVIGHVGRFSRVKNHTYLIDVFKRVVEINDNVRLLLVGDGDERIKIQEKVQALKLQDKVIFTGLKSNVNELLQAMDVFVFPSLYEGLPVTLVEAQSSGLPCIISNNISDECIITKDLVFTMSLEKTVDEWAKMIFKVKKKDRYSVADEVRNSGYDIKTSAKWLENYYLEKSEEIKW